MNNMPLRTQQQRSTWRNLAVDDKTFIAHFPRRETTFARRMAA
jgi:hypothetical protein